MNIVLWITIGGMLGIITSSMYSFSNRGGTFGAASLGVVGGIIGGFSANRLINTSLFTFDINSLAFAIAGAMCLLAIGKLFSTDISRFQKFER
jgi:uncharacterized membrane protein YeaQ/YmgE (transglycosylase-associated protein family)